jgi:hypothetical protein
MKRNAADGLFTKPSDTRRPFIDMMRSKTYAVTRATKYLKVVIPANPGSGPGQAPESRPGKGCRIRQDGASLFNYRVNNEGFRKSYAQQLSICLDRDTLRAIASVENRERKEIPLILIEEYIKRHAADGLLTKPSTLCIFKS